MHNLDKSLEFTALSYEWGRPPRPGDHKPTVQINVLWTVETQVNLDTALCHLRKPNEPLIIWVDAVCINQNDSAEKDQQVGQNLRQRIADVRVARAQRQRQRPRPGHTAEGWGGNAQREQWDIPETAVRRLDQRRSSGRVEPTIARRTPATCPRADPGILPQRYLLFRRVPHTSVKIVLDTDVDTTRGHPFAEARHLLRVPEVGLGCVRGWPRFRPPHQTSCNLRPPLQIRPRWHGRRYSSPRPVWVSDHLQSPLQRVLHQCSPCHHPVWGCGPPCAEQQKEVRECLLGCQTGGRLRRFRAEVSLGKRDSAQRRTSKDPTTSAVTRNGTTLSCSRDALSIESTT